MAYATIWLLSLTVTAHLSPAASQNVDSYCSDRGNYTGDSLYRGNLHIALAALSTIGDSGFLDVSVGEAHLVAMCRADIQPTQCRGCANIAMDDLIRLCPVQLEAMLWQQYCMLRFSDRPIHGVLAASPRRFTIDASYNVTAGLGEFRRVRGALIEDLRAEAAHGHGHGGNLRRAAAGKRIAAGNRSVYAMVQCTPDLSVENCTECLGEAAGFIPGCCDASPGARIYTPSCSIAFEDYEFYNMTRLQQSLESFPGKDDQHKSRNVITIVASVLGLLTLAFCVGIFARIRMKQKKKGEAQIGEDGDEISAVESIQYDFGKLRAATNDFSDANKLGQGGFGAVYKGKLQNSREIAVKRLSRDLGQGEMEFKTEVLLVAKLQHRNLVRLLGFSIKGTERLLVYEFVRNGSLDQFLFDRMKSSYLDWDRRYQIIEGVARGLLYLHQDSRLRIIHRDLKASNVLLDDEMNPKISDFGLAKIVLPDASHERTGRIVGTYGYMAPEYAIHGHFSIKSDVYSFGVLVLELVTGQKKIFLQNGQNSGDLLTYAWRSWREGASASIIDPALVAGGQQEMAERCIHIGLLCVQQNPDERPTMASVVLMLSSFSLTLPLPLEPGFYIQGTSSEASLSQENYSDHQLICSAGNVASITHMYPR